MVAWHVLLPLATLRHPQGRCRRHRRGQHPDSLMADLFGSPDEPQLTIKAWAANATDNF
jgi:hypothetical protein